MGRGKNSPSDDEDKFDHFSYEDADNKDYNFYNFSEQYKEKVGQYITELRESGSSTEDYCYLEYVQTISEHHLIREAPVHFNMCKKKKYIHSAETKQSSCSTTE